MSYPEYNHTHNNNNNRLNIPDDITVVSQYAQMELIEQFKQPPSHITQDKEEVYIQKKQHNHMQNNNTFISDRR